MSRSVFIARTITAIFMLVIGVIVRIDTADLAFGSLRRIQSGFFPTVFGNLLIVLSLFMLITLIWAYIKGNVNEPDTENHKHSLKGFAIFLVIMAAFVVVNYFVGFIIAIFVALLASGFSLGLKGWRLILLGVITTVLIWLVFDVWLTLYLPTGILFS